MKTKSTILTFTWHLFSFVIFTDQALGCFNSQQTATAVHGVKYGPTAVYRCVSVTTGQISCRTTCNSGEIATPNTILPNLNVCIYYGTKFVICYNSITGTAKCENNACLANGTVQVSNISVTYSDPDSCSFELQKLSTVGYIRCNTDSSGYYYPTCRLGICQSNEKQLSSISYSSFSSCLAHLYVDLICYASRIPSSYACPSEFVGCRTAVLATASGATSAAAHRACKNDATVMWVRCQTATRNSRVCRPLNEGCNGTGEATLTGVQAGLSACMSYEASVLCYHYFTTPTTSGNTWTCGLDYNCGAIGTIAINAARAGTSCSSFTPTKWFRCVTTGTVTCRPKEAGCYGSEEQLPSSQEFDTETQCFGYTPTYVRCKNIASGLVKCQLEPCAAGIEQLLAATAVNTWSTKNDCKNNIFWAQPCYVPNQNLPPNYYTITISQDADGGCESIQGAIALQGYTSSSEANKASLIATLQNYYNGDLAFRHQRCNLNGVPVCRPTKTSGCPLSEVLLSEPSILSTLDACLNVRYAIKPCYHATNSSTPSWYYAIVGAMDTLPYPGVCEVTDLALGTDWYRGTTYEIAVAAAVVAGVYSPATNIEHIRCNTNGVPVCRPDLTPGNTNNWCAQWETLLINAFTLNTNENPFSTLNACDAVRWNVRPCYRATTSGEPYYEIVGGSDTVLSPYCPSAGDVPLSPENQIAWHSGPSYVAATAAAATYYTTALQMTHYRCKVGTVPVCRPDMTGNPNNRCPTTNGETQLTPSNSWPTLGECNAARFLVFMCYDKTASIPSDYTCIPDTVGCTAITLALKSASDLSTAISLCQNDDTVLWDRCELASAIQFVCRPHGTETNYGCQTGTGEQHLMPLFSGLTKSNCLNYVAYINCYDKTKYVNKYLNKSLFTCQRDYQFCTGNFVQYPSGGISVSTVFTGTTALGDCQNWPTTSAANSWQRCERYIGNKQKLGLVTCRPLINGVTCNSDEIRSPTSTSSYPSIVSCLRSETGTANDDTSYCRCEDPVMSSTICNEVSKVSITPCCVTETYTKQIPNEGSFYNSTTTCMAS